MTTKIRKTIHPPLRMLLALGEKGNAQAQFELSAHPFLSEEERFHWLVKAVGNGLTAARIELARVQLARELTALYQEASQGHVDAAYQLGIHQKLNPPTQYIWLCHAAGMGHKLAIDDLARCNLLIHAEAMIPIVNYSNVSQRSYLH